MGIDQIRQSIERVGSFFSEHPEKALSADKAATATMDEGLRCSVAGPNGEMLVTDMPKGIGGSASAPTPGWLLRAALASCDATVIAMRAAQLGIVLNKLEVTVDSLSDDRGMLGLGDSIPPGPQSMRIRVRIAAEGASTEELHQLAAWAEAQSPVGDAVRRAIPSHLEIEVCQCGRKVMAPFPPSE